MLPRGQHRRLPMACGFLNHLLRVLLRQRILLVKAAVVFSNHQLCHPHPAWLLSLEHLDHGVQVWTQEKNRLKRVPHVTPPPIRHSFCSAVNLLDHELPYDRKR